MRTINPLGIRKLDVQAIRRERHAEARTEAERTVANWFDDSRNGYGKPMPLTRDNITRLADVMYTRGWERGVTDGAEATRDRVAEALETGALIKP